MSEEQARAVYAFIGRNPGLRASQLAREFGMAEGTLRSILAATERLGLFLYEDEKGKLYVSEEIEHEKETHL